MRHDRAMSIRAVACRARVSTATVSRVVNGSAFVAPATLARVRDAIEALNFYPDGNARALGSGRSGLYGLIISDITNPYFPELVKAFEDNAVAHNQEVLVANTNYDPHRMENCVVRMLQRKVDGVAIMTSEMNEELIGKFAARRIPLVFMDTATVGPGMSVLRVNYKGAVQSAVEHLFSLQHRRIAFISGPLHLRSACLRAEAFHQALQQHGLAERKHWVQVGDYRVEGGHRAMLRILGSGKTLPTAVLASNDLTAIGAMGAIREKGLRIPEDISVVGFDGIELSAYTQPALTTLVIPRQELSALAFRSLYRARGQDHCVGSEYIIETHLAVRGSTAPAVTRAQRSRPR